MPHEVICPHCGATVVFDLADGPPASKVSIDVAHTVETLIPGTACNDDGPHADSGGVIMATPEHHMNGLTEVFSEHTYAVPAPSSNSGEFDALASPVADPMLDAFVTEEPTASVIMRPAGTHGSGDGMHPPGFAIDAAISSDVRPGPEIEGDLDRQVRPSWAPVLLGSYASAATMAILWLLWTGQGRSTPVETLPRAARQDVLKTMAQLAPLFEDRRTTLGKTITVGSLEFTPLDVTLGPVPLKGGGDDALILRVRLKNISRGETFVPLEKAMIRTQDSGFSPTSIETQSGLIETYPLAVFSERSLTGQDLDRLQPGETVETILVSDRDAKEKLTETMTWRVRLRVDPANATTVGVRFSRGDVR